MSDICGDNRFEVIEEAKKDLIDSTNIEMSPDEMSVIDNILFRCWQMGWLRQYETYEFCDGENPCKEYDREKHCCHRWTKVIRETVEEMQSEWRTAKVIEHDASITDTDGNKYLRTEYLCGACKKKVIGGDEYCSHCGTKLDWSRNE